MAFNQVTESWREKRYEQTYTQRFFNAGSMLRMAQAVPTIQNVQNAYAYIREISTELIENKQYTKTYNNFIKKEIKRIGLILYGMPNNPDVIMAMKAYDVRKHHDERNNETKITNLQNVLDQLWDIHRLTKTFAYKLGFFAKRPFERARGMAGIEEGLQQ